MGEVGVNPAESTNSTAMKVNGDTNGAAPTGNAPVANCSADVEEIEDTSQEDSQDTQDTIQSNAKAASIDDEMDTEATSQDEEASCDNDSVKEVSAHNGDSVQKMETGEDDTQESSITNEKSRDGMENGTASSGSSASDSEKIDDDDEESNMNDENLDAKEVKSKNETTDALKNPLIKLDEKSQESSNSADTDSSAKELTSKLDSSLEITKVDKVVSAPASKENGHTVVRKPPLIINDDNDAILLSDSDDDDPPPPTKSITNGNDVVHEIESDKEDCVVVEDDKRDSLSPRRSGRSRKSAVKVREFSTFDDDIEEVIEDPLQLPAAKKPRMSPSSLNQITMKDARSLLDSNETYQQQFIQANNKKEPRLVIIDTNSIMSRGGGSTTMQAIQKQSGFSVTPVQHSPQMQITPTFNANANAQRPGLVPIGMSTTQKSTILQQTVQQPVVGLFPGLTDDMHVLEAPSFIVPYIYEKPPTLVLSDVVAKIGVELDEMKKKEAKEEKDVKKATTVKDDAEASTSKTVGAKAVSSEAKSSKKSRKSKTQNKTGDESWDESDTSTDEEASDTEERTKVLIKEATEDLEVIKTHIIGTPELIKETIVTPTTASADLTKKSENYFESALGKFFMDIGINLVQEHVQSDLLRQQKRRRNRDGTATPPNIQMAINSLMKNLEISRETNEPFKFDMKRCEYCNFKSESALAMANHYETPHMKKYGYKCNFCTFDSRSPQDIVFHMEAVHNVKGQLERPLSYHQCPNCPFEDNGKAKLSRHALFCAKKYRPELNMAPPSDWEPPAKIPRVKPRHGLVGTATAYQVSMQNRNMNNTITSLPRGMTVVNATANTNTVQRNRGGKQNQMTRMPANVTGIIRNNQQMQQQPMNMKQLPGITMSGLSVTSNYQMAANSYLQMAGTGMTMVSNSNNSISIQSASSMANKNNKAGQQPSISITPLPRTTNVTNQSIGHNLATISAMSNAVAAGSSNKGANASGTLKPGQSPTGAKANFVICEICDGYIKDLDQLRNHMQWMHKVKIHPKMIYNRPPLNCQKCQFRFFTDQGLERHLLGSHGLVTSSMQDAANKGKDAGRCPVCGRMYQWKLLNHVSRDHAMTLKPAHLSYKCTVCTATFGMYKQFENHVYSAHNTIAKKAMDKKSGGSSSSAPSSNTNKLNNLVSGDSLLKPIKINDEITIIPQPATLKNNLRTSSSTTITPISNNHTVIDISGGSSTRRQHRKQTKNSIQKIQK